MSAAAFRKFSEIESVLLDKFGSTDSYYLEFHLDAKWQVDGGYLFVDDCKYMCKTQYVCDDTAYISCYNSLSIKDINELADNIRPHTIHILNNKNQVK